MSARVRGTRLEAEVDRCRSECKWKRLGELMPSVRSKDSGMEQFADLLEAEHILETFVEKYSGMLFIKSFNFLFGCHKCMNGKISIDFAS